jgi:hypothetical protein
MAKTVTKPVRKSNRKLVAKVAYVVDEVTKIAFAGGVYLVKNDAWYVIYNDQEGPIGMTWFHCLIKKGVPMFVTEKDYGHPRKYTCLGNYDLDGLNVIERRT